MKFSSIVLGTRAERALDVPGVFEPDDPTKPFRVLLRPLTGVEHEAACAAARKRAIDKGVTDPRIGDPIYDIAMMAYVVAVGCIDPDSPKEDRQPSFESADQVLANLSPELIVLLHEHHEAWQDECSPYVRKLGGEDLSKVVREVAGPDGHATFMLLSPSTRVNFATSTARTLSGLLDLKSSSGSSSESSPSSSVKPPPRRGKPSSRRTPSGRG